MQALRLAAATVSVLVTFAAGPHARAAEVKIDRTQRAQTIDGFGFFGAHHVWWGETKDMVNAAWFDIGYQGSVRHPFADEDRDPAALVPFDADGGRTGHVDVLEGLRGRTARKKPVAGQVGAGLGRNTQGFRPARDTVTPWLGSWHVLGECEQ